MKSVKSVLQTVGGTVGEVSEAAPAAASYDHGKRRDLVDAVNQVFAEFELAYHNQYHKAYAQEGSVAVAKKYWLSCLCRFSPDVILKATRQLVGSQEYLPSLPALIKACEQSLSLFGLPSPHEAYVEACCAPSPKAEHAWSHPAVYLAGKAVGWFVLANEPESRARPLFEYHYGLLCRRVLNGEVLEREMPEPLPPPGGHALSPEQNKARLQELRRKLKL